MRCLSFPAAVDSGGKYAPGELAAPHSRRATANAPHMGICPVAVGHRHTCAGAAAVSGAMEAPGLSTERQGRFAGAEEFCPWFGGLKLPFAVAFPGRHGPATGGRLNVRRRGERSEPVL